MLVRRAGLTAVRWLYIIRKVGSDKRGGNGFLQGCKAVVRGGEEGRVGSKKVHAKRQKKGESWYSIILLNENAQKRGWLAFPGYNTLN